MAIFEQSLLRNGVFEAKNGPQMYHFVKCWMISLWKFAGDLIRKLLIAYRYTIPILTPEIPPDRITENLQELNRRIAYKDVTCKVLNNCEKPQYDIIFIHGLYGSLENTWRQGRWYSKYKKVPKLISIKRPSCIPDKCKKQPYGPELKASIRRPNECICDFNSNKSNSLNNNYNYGKSDTDYLSNEYIRSFNNDGIIKKTYKKSQYDVDSDNNIDCPLSTDEFDLIDDDSKRYCDNDSKMTKTYYKSENNNYNDTKIDTDKFDLIDNGKRYCDNDSKMIKNNNKYKRDASDYDVETNNFNHCECNTEFDLIDNSIDKSKMEITNKKYDNSDISDSDINIYENDFNYDNTKFDNDEFYLTEHSSRYCSVHNKMMINNKKCVDSDKSESDVYNNDSDSLMNGKYDSEVRIIEDYSRDERLRDMFGESISDIIDCDEINKSDYDFNSNDDDYEGYNENKCKCVHEKDMNDTRLNSNENYCCDKRFCYIEEFDGSDEKAISCRYELNDNKFRMGSVDGDSDVKQTYKAHSNMASTMGVCQVSCGCFKIGNPNVLVGDDLTNSVKGQAKQSHQNDTNGDNLDRSDKKSKANCSCATFQRNAHSNVTNGVNLASSARKCQVGCGCDCAECYSECWPRDWLKIDHPNARVISVNYTSDPYLWRPIWIKQHSRSSLEQRAKDMTEQLLDLNVGCRPIIWIGHSKGGLYIKQIYSEAYRCSDDSKSLWYMTRGIMFYSVPHRGSHLADLNIPPFISRSIELLEIRQNCASVLGLHRIWLEAVYNAQTPPIVRSLVETNRTLMAVLWLRIVSFESADPDVGALCGVTVDHREVCKPRSRNCKLYKELLNLISASLDNL